MIATVGVVYFLQSAVYEYPTGDGSARRLRNSRRDRLAPSAFEASQTLGVQRDDPLPPPELPLRRPPGDRWLLFRRPRQRRNDPPADGRMHVWSPARRALAGCRKSPDFIDPSTGFCTRMRPEEDRSMRGDDQGQPDAFSYVDA